jgi:hypothetical protein
MQCAGARETGAPAARARGGKVLAQWKFGGTPQCAAGLRAAAQR